MSDQTQRRRDQRPLPSARISPANRLRPDLRPRVPDLLLALTLATTACVRAPEPRPGPEVHRVEVWVDGFSRPGGDGSRDRPFKTLPQPLPPGALVRLRSGVYAGPFTLAAGARLEGQGEVVLTGADGAPAVVTAADAELDGLSIQGGAVGLEAGANVKATRVRFSGQRQRAVRVRGALWLSDAELVASVEGIDGLWVERGATLELTGARFSGGFRRAVQSEGGTLRLTSVRAQGVKTLVHALDARSTLAGLQASSGSGPALFFAGGRVTLAGAEVLGHEYALQLAREAVAEVSGLRARGSLEACVASTGATLSLSRSTLWDCGPGGALSLMHSKTELSGVEVLRARELGVFVREGQLTLRGGLTVRGVSGTDGVLGDALHVREATVRDQGGGHFFSELEGSGVFASAFADVQLAQVTVERARSSAFFVERRAQLQLGAALVRGGGGPAIVVPDDASVRVGKLFVAGGNEAPVFAECHGGARVQIDRLETTVPQLPSRCVTVGP